jgi:hypothetical protein
LWRWNQISFVAPPTHRTHAWILREKP